MSRLKDKSIEAARKRERKRNKVKSVINPLEAFKKVWEGPSNHGTARISPTGLTDPPPDKIVQSVQRAFAKHEKAGRGDPDYLGPERRKQIAANYREMADGLERK
jgi:hypothetical protein